MAVSLQTSSPCELVWCHYSLMVVSSLMVATVGLSRKMTQIALWLPNIVAIKDRRRAKEKSVSQSRIWRAWAKHKLPPRKMEANRHHSTGQRISKTSLPVWMTAVVPLSRLLLHRRASYSLKQRSVAAISCSGPRLHQNVRCCTKENASKASTRQKHSPNKS